MEVLVLQRTEHAFRAIAFSKGMDQGGLAFSNMDALGMPGGMHGAKSA